MAAVDAAWWILMGGLFAAYVVLVVRVARDRTAGRARRVLPHLLILAGGLIFFTPRVLGLGRASRLRVGIVGIVIVLVGYALAYARRRPDKSGALTSPPPDDKQS
jgi:membrane protein CcdC involved in cytochrome C biogenesis